MITAAVSGDEPVEVTISLGPTEPALARMSPAGGGHLASGSGVRTVGRRALKGDRQA